MDNLDLNLILIRNDIEKTSNLIFLLKSYETFYKGEVGKKVYLHLNIIRDSFIKELNCNLYDLLNVPNEKNKNSEILSIYSMLSEVKSDSIIHASIEKNVKEDISKQSLCLELKDLKLKYNK
jgi:hypothetical protein